MLFATLLMSSTYIQFIDADSLNHRAGNVRTLYKEAGRERGPILVAGDAVAQSVPVDDQYKFLRKYPGGALYAPITGYYSAIYGSQGMERAERDILTGTADELAFTRISDLLTGGTTKGAAVELTINPAAQRAAWKLLGNQRGAVVAIDPKTGDILALVSKPSYDPNTLAGHNSDQVAATAKRLQEDKTDRPLDNRAIGGRQYPPGSVFKLVTSAAALSEGMKPETEIPGPAELPLPGTRITLPNEFGGPCGPGGKSTLMVALARSCNTSYGGLGLQLGDEKLRAQAEKFGFGQELSVPLKVTPSEFPADPNAPQTGPVGDRAVRGAGDAAAGGHGVRRDRQPRCGDAAEPGPLDTIHFTASDRSTTPPRAVDRRESGRRRRSDSDDGERRGERDREACADRRGQRGRQDRDGPAGRRPSAARLVHLLRAGRRPAGGGRRRRRGRRQLGDETSGGRAAAPIAKAVMEAVLNP